ncbi:HNH endonuclease [Salmonella enterica]|nr:HNH endonuclease [Salmonella enterica subsp. salamae]ECL1288116.1 HNH endonuclease [Salmonella enterica]ECJ2729162.1 HNH endonuclease [Salmonella enterica subsp. salamae]EEA0957382.1 HNH endonuclease [Salmonella enterica]EGH5308830.1 HNH endonuclease [Salmonella enterica]
MDLFEQYLLALPKKNRLSDVKLTILKRLWWADDVDFPKPWVSSAELLELTGQKYFDRRTRELRDQLGCDLESSYIVEFSGHAWRLKSSTISPPMDREYLTESQRSALFFNHSYSCSTCGKIVAAGVRGLQADHKIPLSRGGGNDLTNWQALCHNCNVGKRRACENCKDDCYACSWAFPEIIGIPTMINLSEATLRKVRQLSDAKGISLSEVIDYAIRKL